jgi:serine acetyltransferase/GT2 family glycosyltransferase
MATKPKPRENGAKKPSTVASEGTTERAASVVIPSFNRGGALVELLEQFVDQSAGMDAFEVIVVDDGSTIDPRPTLPTFAGKLTLHVERQPNGGAARARQRGAELARGELLIFLDDDMQISRTFVGAHRAAHDGRPRAAVLGRLRALPSIAKMPLFERYYARMLDRMAAQADDLATRETGLPGPKLYTGNMSIPKALFFEAGGFDADFRLLEDVELGIRLERVGGRIFFSSEAEAVHGSDHVSTKRWLERSRRDGVYATKVAHKHPDYAAASPFWHVSRINRLSRPVLAMSAAAPPVGAALAQLGMGVAQAADRLGMSRAAVAGTTLVYGIQFYRGVREETGGFGDLMREYRAFQDAVASVTDGASPASLGLFAAVRADHAMLQRSQGKYGVESHPRPLTAEVVQNIGLQILVAYRVMRALHLSGHGVAAKIMSRVIRHLYGSDLHWEADFAPGIVLVHGFGLAISKAARVSEGCILFHGVTLGMGRDGKTGATGAPLLERDVLVGVGATLVGPITVGHESKIMAGCTVTQSVPARSLVEAPAVAVRAR